MLPERKIFSASARGLDNRIVYKKQESICQIPIKKKQLLSYQFASYFKEFIAIIYIFTLTKYGGAFFAGGSVSP